MKWKTWRNILKINKNNHGVVFIVDLNIKKILLKNILILKEIYNLRFWHEADHLKRRVVCCGWVADYKK